MIEYKTAKGWAIFIYIMAPCFIALFGWMIMLPFEKGNFSPNASWILIPIGLGMIALMVLGVIDIYKGRLIIHERGIRSVGALAQKELLFEEIKGYTVNDKFLLIEPRDKQKKRIKVSQYIQGRNEIQEFLSRRYPDLDQQNAIEEEKEILSDESLGFSQEERVLKLKRARNYASIINWAGGIAAAWVFFYPTPYAYANLSAILVPVLAVIMVNFSEGLIHIDVKKGSAYPAITFALLYPACALMFRSLIDYDIFKYTGVWMPVIILTLAFLALVLMRQQEQIRKKSLSYLSIAAIALLLFAYSFGTVIHVNCYYDRSTPAQYQARILDKRISSGKSRSYYLKLSSWGPQQEEAETRVSSGLYERVAVGDQVNIWFSKGKLEIPWYQVTE